MEDSLRTLRSFRPVGNIAAFDTIVSYVVALILIRYFYKGRRSPYLLALLVFPLGIAVHWVLSIPTQLNYRLGISERPDAFSSMAPVS